ncbi:hypothetical protein EWM64_g9891 [Hericium alpestre]|uniref:Amidohydrolase 3 domain-containing protein n=1 Tax=Hericium alpestre TaxID=135208 RepID=A0A4Y9ZJU4_9AGAM|nr:hypothetical protein EWM64_g9891 [Hericium alpestre]
MQAKDSGILIIRNVRQAVNDNQHKTYDLYCASGVVTAIYEKEPTDDAWPPRIFKEHLESLLYTQIDLKGKGIILPSTFQEALEVTTKAKADFGKHIDDVYARGRRLVVESLECGVTVMRAHVEVDRTVQLRCLDVALRLKEEFHACCDIQISVFAQDPLFEDTDAEEPGSNYRLLEDAAGTSGVSVVGSAPYVESKLVQSQENISLILRLAARKQLHADFHLDYNVDASSPPLIYDLLDLMRSLRWTQQSPKDEPRMVTIGHGTRYTLFNGAEWNQLKECIGDLPVALVALPQSDMYMMGKGGGDRAVLPPRATLPVPFVASRGIRVALSVNNVDNAFTPQGSVDPLGLCPLGVTVYQDASETACTTLLKSVSTEAKYAIGLRQPAASKSLSISQGDPADFVILHENSSVRSAVLNPCYTRTTIRAGRVVAYRRAERWSAIADPTKGRPLYRRLLVFMDEMSLWCAGFVLVVAYVVWAARQELHPAGTK